MDFIKFGVLFRIVVLICLLLFFLFSNGQERKSISKLPWQHIESITGKGFKLIKYPVPKEKIFGFSVLPGVGFHRPGKTILSDETQLINNIKSDPALQQILAEQFGPNYKITNSTKNPDEAAKNQILLRLEAQGNLNKYVALYFALTGSKFSEHQYLTIHTPASGETGTTQQEINVSSHVKIANIEPGVRFQTPGFSGISLFAGAGYIFQNIKHEKYRLKLLNNEYPMETMSSKINQQFIALNSGAKIRMTENIFGLIMGNYVFHTTLSQEGFDQRLSIFTGLQVVF